MKENVKAPKKTTILQTIIAYIREYFLISSVHGLYHIVNSRNPLEKIIWMILVLLSAYFGYSLSAISLNRYYTNPVVVSIERDMFSWTTSLPAVTVCPIKNLNQTALDEYIKSAKTSNQTALREFLVSLYYANYTNFENVLENDEVAPEDYVSVIFKLHGRQKPEITVSGQLLGTKEWAYETITEVGVCYCFNSQLAVYNSLQFWMENKWEILPPLKTFEVHPLDGEVFANIVNLTTAFNVYIHGPYEVADLRTRPLFLPADYFLQVYVTALSIISSENTKALQINQRQCRYHFESDLLHFPVYTYVLCRIECRIMLANKLCGCVPHFYRKRPGEKICNVKGLHCLSQHKDQLIYLEDVKCTCAANCEEVNYAVEEMDLREWFLGSNLQYGIRNFPEMRFKRDIIFGFDELLVYIGGIIGLFQGASLLTFTECVYYFTLRLFWTIKGKIQSR